MMNAILMAVVRFLETVVQYSLGAVAIALVAIGAIVACRWLLHRSDAGGSFFGRTLRRGSGSLALLVVLASTLFCVLSGMMLWSR